MVERQLPKLHTTVRSRSPAPILAPFARQIPLQNRPFGIKADRLDAEGVGPLAPVASNADETKRAKNRQVEMVLR